MAERQRPGFGEAVRRFFLDLDARIDSGLFEAARWSRELYERFVTFMDRFHVAGWKRWALVEPASEAATIGAGGLVLALALALPAFNETSDEDWLKKSELAVQFLDRYGNEVGARGIKHNDSIPIEDFPDHLIKATLSTEDRRFYEHFGIDIPGTLRAVVTNARAGGVVQGGSSITQQLAKNLFLSNERTIERKVKEAFLAVWLETRLTKNQILKLYLDRAYLGGGAYGVDAAAQYYFNKSARELNLSEVRDDGWVVQGADALCAAHQPAGRPCAREHGARQSDRGRDDDGRPGLWRPSQSRKRRGPARRAAAELLSRLRLRRNEEACRQAAEVGSGARFHRPHRPRRQSSATVRTGGRGDASRLRTSIWRASGRNGRVRK